MIDFTVIIPHYNDEARLYHCLDSIHAQEYDLDHVEMIVVDDCSPVDIKSQIHLRFPNVHFFRLIKKGGPGAARNLGIAKAHGKYIAFVDSDVMVTPHWLKTFRREFERGEKIVCGPVFHPNNFLGKITALTSFGNFLDTMDGYKPNCLSGNYAMVAELQKAILYPENMYSGEDVLVSSKFKAAGLSIRYVVDAWVLHSPNLKIRNFNNRAYLYGLGFSSTRSIDSTLPGFWLHEHLKGASCFFLFFIRISLDLMRMLKHRKILEISFFEIVPSIAGIIWVRLVYSVGVAKGYRKNNLRKNDNKRNLKSF